MSFHIKASLTAGVFILAAFLLYRVPAIRARMDWRVDRTVTYARGIIDSAGPVPTPLPVTEMPAATGFASETPAALDTPTPAPTATRPTPTPTPFPATITLTKPGYEAQGTNNCGPATLVMALRYYGWHGDQYDISDLIKPIPADRNVNPEELAYYVRNHAGWLRVETRIGGSIDLLRRLLAAGFPIIIEETFTFKAPYWPNDDLWAAHYLLLTGYDDPSHTFIAQDSYHGPNEPVTYDDTLERWESFNYLYMLIYLPEQEDALRAIVGADWDPGADRANALAQAQAATAAKPDDAFAWFNLGSDLVSLERYPEAAQAYDTARKLGLPQRMLRYQFGPFIAYFRSDRIDDLLALTKYALQRTSNSEEALLWNGWGLYRQGDKQGAISNWQKALEARPGYADAQYALNYAAANP
jgi:tetratricopeptide (TPR) repeat protein